MGRVQDKVAFITGAGAGIAKAAALLFAREGAKVILAEINEAHGRATEQAVKDAGGEALFVQTDVTQEDAVKKAVAEGVKRFGRIDILFNCAGGSVVDDAYVTEVDIAKVWDRTLQLNLMGAMLCCRHGIPELIKAGGGAVINMSSGAALRGGSHAHMYTATKGAIISLTRALAGAYVQQNIRVNAVAAGRIKTERTVGRYGATADAGGPVEDRQDGWKRAQEYPLWIGEPIDIANIVLFLASNESRMITGATIPADGGRSAY
jgi:NAD(P)-dependent dehydrogenase (short-subunit alcohol dehydrogenase family)